MNKIKLHPARIRNTNSDSFRHFEWAEIIGVYFGTPHGFDERLVYQCAYEDGYVDYIPVSDRENYEISR